MYRAEVADKILKKGMEFNIPFARFPSQEPPCRAIIKAAGIPGKQEGRGRLTRRRFVRLVMSVGNDKRFAEALASAVHISDMTYRDALRMLVVSRILIAEESMARFSDLATVTPEIIIISDEVEPEADTADPEMDEGTGNADTADPEMDEGTGNADTAEPEMDEGAGDAERKEDADAMSIPDESAGDAEV